MANEQFDSSLGGSEHLPYSCNTLKFASARSVEIAAMTESILCPSQTKLIFQTLPVHMRRRVMSHNAKRLPRKLRKGHMEQLKKSGLPPKQKRPSRKHRRRPGNLLEEYNRRKINNIWLETHIWHAKRFHMKERWGCKLAYAPCDKAFRACYRATSKHCLLQDISYYIPVQIKGKLNTIKSMFDLITSPLCNLGIGSKAYISGDREGSVHLYKPNSYPFGYIGKINYLWEPGLSDSKILWLFVHPAFIPEIKDSFQELCSQQLNNEKGDIPIKKKRIESDNLFTVKYFDNTYNIFRLTGPNSHAILSRSLKCIETTNDIKIDNWFSKHCSGFEMNLEEKFQYWTRIKELSSPSQLPARMVLSLIVKDPRLSRPNIRTKASKAGSINVNPNIILTIPKFASKSPLWDESINKSIKEKKLTNGQFIKRVTDTQLIPGEINENDPEMQSVPVVLIQKNGSQIADYKKLGFGSGWDIIVPSGYGLPFWQTFIMFGGRAGGLRETESLTFEMGECYLPPDSDAGIQEELRIELEMKDRYFKLPPSKRLNYIKMGVNSPFRCPWKILINEWSEFKTNSLFVLRDKKLLLRIQECLIKKIQIPNQENADLCLIPVYVQIEGKGNLKRHAHICLPKANDFKDMKTIYEPLHVDTNKDARKILRKNHRTDLKKLRRKRLKLKRKMKSKGIASTTKKNKEPSKYINEMRELWLPSNIEKVREACSRELLGYISTGAFSFSQACSCGVGYMPYNALKTLLKSGQNNVLIRNVCSRKYRKASFKIVHP